MSQASSAESAMIGTPEEIAYETRAAEGSIWTGGRLLIGIFAFAFASLAFAYFYLRSSNSEGLWHPNSLTAPTATGTAIMAIALGSAVLVGYGLHRMRHSAPLDWAVAWWLAVLGGLVALGLQAWELTDLPFLPGSSGYASCFIGWATMNMVLLVSAVYWAETLLARELRLRKAFREEGGAGAAMVAPRMFRINVEACAYFWGFVVVVSVFFWVFFYVTV